MASGDTLQVFTPLNNEPPASDYATIHTRNSHIVLDFDDGSSNESAVFSSVMPRHYSGQGIRVFLHYSMTSAEADTVDWDVSFERIGDQQLDVDTDSFASAQSVDNTTVPGTSGNVDIVYVDFEDGSEMDSVEIGESYRLKVTRDSISDDATGDAELHKVELRET